MDRIIAIIGEPPAEFLTGFEHLYVGIDAHARQVKSDSCARETASYDGDNLPAIVDIFSGGLHSARLLWAVSDDTHHVTEWLKLIIYLFY
jgi:hypothetical protein